jgi:2,5-dioxopentanoate dehydrogenase
MGVGQFCTKPGIVFALGGPDFEKFAADFRLQVRAVKPATMLHSGICDAYYTSLDRLRELKGVVVLAESDADVDQESTQGEAVVFATDVENFLLHRELQEEVFGPFTLLVAARSVTELEAAARSLAGQLTATVHATPDEAPAFADLFHILERKAGRLLLNGYPTGVEVCPSMQHGGPYPATTDARFTSVGTAAILRWVRPLCWQNFPDAALPEALRNANSRGILRTVNGLFTRNPVS